MPRSVGFDPDKLPALFMTAHEKECALAAIAARIEKAKKAKSMKELREMKRWYREVLMAAILPNG